MLLLAADKASRGPAEMHDLQPPHVAVHGTMSVEVNFHALAMWFAGGCNSDMDAAVAAICLHSPQRCASVDTMLLARGMPQRNLPLTSATFAWALQHVGLHDWFVFRDHVEDALLAWLRKGVHQAEDAPATRTLRDVSDVHPSPLHAATAVAAVCEGILLGSGLDADAPWQLEPYLNWLKEVALPNAPTLERLKGHVQRARATDLLQAEGRRV